MAIDTLRVGLELSIKKALDQYKDFERKLTNTPLEVKVDAKKSIKDAQAYVKKNPIEVEAQFNGAMNAVREFRRKAEEQLKDIKIGFDTSKVDDQIRDIRAKVARERPIIIETELRIKAVAQQLRGIQQAVERSNKKVAVSVELKAKNIRGQLNAIQKEIDAAESLRVDVKLNAKGIDADLRGIESQVKQLNDAVKLDAKFDLKGLSEVTDTLKDFNPDLHVNISPENIKLQLSRISDEMERFTPIKLPSVIVGRKIKTRLKGIEDHIKEKGYAVKVPIEMRLTNPSAQLRNISKGMKQLAGVKVGVDLKLTDGAAKIRTLGASLPDDIDVPVKVGLKITDPVAQIKGLQSALKGKGKLSVTTDLKVDEQILDKLDKTLNRIESGSFSAAIDLGNTGDITQLLQDITKITEGVSKLKISVGDDPLAGLKADLEQFEEKVVKLKVNVTDGDFKAFMETLDEIKDRNIKITTQADLETITKLTDALDKLNTNDAKINIGSGDLKAAVEDLQFVEKFIDKQVKLTLKAKQEESFVEAIEALRSGKGAKITFNMDKVRQSVEKVRSEFTNEEFQIKLTIDVEDFRDALTRAAQMKRNLIREMEQEEKNATKRAELNKRLEAAQTLKELKALAKELNITPTLGTKKADYQAALEQFLAMEDAARKVMDAWRITGQKFDDIQDEMKAKAEHVGDAIWQAENHGAADLVRFAWERTHKSFIDIQNDMASAAGRAGRRIAEALEKAAKTGVLTLEIDSKSAMQDLSTFVKAANQAIKQDFVDATKGVNDAIKQQMSVIDSLRRARENASDEAAEQINEQINDRMRLIDTYQDQIDAAKRSMRQSKEDLREQSRAFGILINETKELEKQQREYNEALEAASKQKDAGLANIAQNLIKERQETLKQQDVTNQELAKRNDKLNKAIEKQNEDANKKKIATDKKLIKDLEDIGKGLFELESKRIKERNQRDAKASKERVEQAKNEAKERTQEFESMYSAINDLGKQLDREDKERKRDQDNRNKQIEADRVTYVRESLQEINRMNNEFVDRRKQNDREIIASNKRVHQARLDNITDFQRQFEQADREMQQRDKNRLKQQENNAQLAAKAAAKAAADAAKQSQQEREQKLSILYDNSDIARLRRDLAEIQNKKRLIEFDTALDDSEVKEALAKLANKEHEVEVKLKVKIESEDKRKGIGGIVDNLKRSFKKAGGAGGILKNIGMGVAQGIGQGLLEGMSNIAFEAVNLYQNAFSGLINLGKSSLQEFGKVESVAKSVAFIQATRRGVQGDLEAVDELQKRTQDVIRNTSLSDANKFGTEAIANLTQTLTKAGAPLEFITTNLTNIATGATAADEDLSKFGRGFLEFRNKFADTDLLGADRLREGSDMLKIYTAALSAGGVTAEQFGKAVQYANPLRKGTEEAKRAAAVLTALAQAGTRGSKASTDLNRITTELATSLEGNTKKAMKQRETLEKLTLEIEENGKVTKKSLKDLITNEDGTRIKDMTEIIPLLSRAYREAKETMGEPVAISMFNELLGTKGFQALNNLEFVAKEALATQMKMIESAQKSGGKAGKGYADQFALAVQRGYTGALTQIENTLDGLKISIGESLEPIATASITILNNAIKGATNQGLGLFETTLTRVQERLTKFGQNKKVVDQLATAFNRAALTIGDKLLGYVEELVNYLSDEQNLKELTDGLLFWVTTLTDAFVTATRLLVGLGSLGAKVGGRFKRFFGSEIINSTALINANKELGVTDSKIVKLKNEMDANKTALEQLANVRAQTLKTDVDQLAKIDAQEKKINKQLAEQKVKLAELQTERKKNLDVVTQIRDRLQEQNTRQGAENASSWARAFDKLKDAAKPVIQAFDRMATALLPSLNNIMADLAEIFGITAEEGSGLQTDLIDLVTIGLTPLVKALELGVGALRRMAQAFNAFTGGADNSDRPLKTLATNMGRLDEYWKSENWEYFAKGVVQSVDEAGKGFGDFVVNATTGVDGFLKGAGEGFMDFAKGVGDTTVQAGTSFGDFIKGASDKAHEGFNNIGEAVSNWKTKFDERVGEAKSGWDEFSENTKAKWNETVTAWTNAFKEWKEENFDRRLEDAKNKWREFTEGLKTKFEEAFRQMLENVTRFATEMRDKLIAAWNNFTQELNKFPGYIQSFLNDPLGTVQRKIDDIGQRIANWLNPLRQVGGKLREIGGAIISNGQKLAAQAQETFDFRQILGFSRGGVLPGYSTQDDQIILARSGEGIIVPEAVKALGGPNGIEKLNRLAEKGMLQGYSSGGVVGSGEGPAPVAPSGGGLPVANFYLKQIYNRLSTVSGQIAGILRRIHEMLQSQSRSMAFTPGTKSINGSVIPKVPTALISVPDSSQVKQLKGNTKTATEQLSVVVDAISKITKSFGPLQEALRDVREAIDSEGLEGVSEAARKLREEIGKVSDPAKANIKAAAASALAEIAPRTTSGGGIDEALRLLVKDLKRSEGFRNRPYNDGVNVQTIGYGETRADIVARGYISEPEAAKLLAERAMRDYLQPALDLIPEAVRRKMTVGQAVAVGSFAYNAGIGGFRNSQFGRNVIAGNFERASAVLPETYINRGTPTEAGLRNRRKAEQALFNSGGGLLYPVEQIQQTGNLLETLFDEVNTSVEKVTDSVTKTIPKTMEDLIDRLPTKLREITRDVLDGKLTKVQGSIADLLEGIADSATYTTGLGNSLSAQQKAFDSYLTGLIAAQEYGASRDGGRRRHAGQDFDIAGDNATFQSFIGGEVTRVGYDPGGYFRYIDIFNEALGKVERIAELAEFNVKVGDRVRPGQVVGRGEISTGVVHYEIRNDVNSQRQGGFGFNGTEDPIQFLVNLGIYRREGNKLVPTGKTLGGPAVQERSIDATKVKANLERLLASGNDPNVVLQQQALAQRQEQSRTVANAQRLFNAGVRVDRAERSIANLQSSTRFDTAIAALNQQTRNLFNSKAAFKEDRRIVDAQIELKEALDDKEEVLKRQAVRLEQENVKQEQRRIAIARNTRLSARERELALKALDLDRQQLELSLRSTLTKRDQRIGEAERTLEKVLTQTGFSQSQRQVADLAAVRKQIRKGELNEQEMAAALERLGIAQVNGAFTIVKALKSNDKASKARSDRQLGELEKLFRGQGVVFSDALFKSLELEYNVYRQKLDTQLNKATPEQLEFLLQKGLLRTGSFSGGSFIRNAPGPNRDSLGGILATPEFARTADENAQAAANRIADIYRTQGAAAAMKAMKEASEKIKVAAPGTNPGRKNARGAGVTELENLPYTSSNELMQAILESNKKQGVQVSDYNPNNYVASETTGTLRIQLPQGLIGGNSTTDTLVRTTVEQIERGLEDPNILRALLPQILHVLRTDPQLRGLIGGGR